MAALRAAIAGTGFIGRVHARSAPPGRRSPRRLSPPRRPRVRRGRGRRARRGARLRLGRGARSRPGRRRRPHLHAEPPPRPARRGRARRGQARDLREAAGARRRRRAAARRRRGRVGPPGRRARSSTATTRRCARRASASRAGRPAPLRLLHGTYLQDWLLRPDDANWRVDERARRRLARVRRHRLALVRPGRVRLRPSDRARCPRGCSPRSPERVRDAGGRHAFAAGDDGDGRARSRPRTPPLVQFETDAGAIGSVVVSQISAGRKNRLWIELDGAEEALAFDQEQPEELWCGRRESLTIVRRDPATLSPAAARFAFLPAGHPQGYADCFDAVRRRRLRRRSATARCRTGRRRSPTACAPR